MKVKELAEIFNVGIAELLDLLENVGVDIADNDETMVDKNTEKKLAKRYNVDYPFKTNKVAKKPTNSVVIPGKTKEVQQQNAPKQEKKEEKEALEKEAFLEGVKRNG